MTLYGVYTSLALRHRKRKLKKQPEVINENYKPFVSIMIPAHNEESVITNTVENIRNLIYPNYEIILIDDRSDDILKKAIDIVLPEERKHLAKSNIEAIMAGHEQSLLAC